MFDNFYEYISNITFVNINNFTNIVQNLLYIFFNIELELEQKYIANNAKTTNNLNKNLKQYENITDDEKCEWGWFIFIDE